jgi:hypothetical protein
VEVTLKWTCKFFNISDLKKNWNFFGNFFGFFIKKSVKISYFWTVHTENVRESRNFSITEQENKKNGTFLGNFPGFISSSGIPKIQ